MKYIPARFVMAFDKANAEETPFPAPDMSSPKSSLANLSFIKSVSEKKDKKNIKQLMSGPSCTGKNMV